MLRWGFCVSVFSSRRCQKHRTYRQRNYLGTACGSTSIVWEELHAGVSLGFDCQCCCGHLVFSSIPSSFLQYFARLLNYSCFQYLFFHAAVGSPTYIPTVSMSVGGARLLLFKNNRGDGKHTFQMYLWPIFMALWNDLEPLDRPISN